MFQKINTFKKYHDVFSRYFLHQNEYFNQNEKKTLKNLILLIAYGCIYKINKLFYFLLFSSSSFSSLLLLLFSSTSFSSLLFPSLLFYFLLFSTTSFSSLLLPSLLFYFLLFSSTSLSSTTFLIFRCHAMVRRTSFHLTEFIMAHAVPLLRVLPPSASFTLSTPSLPQTIIILFNNYYHHHHNNNSNNIN